MSIDGSQVFVTGSSGNSRQSSDYATVAYNAATGVPNWATRYNGPGNSTDTGVALAVSPERSQVFVTGESIGSTNIDYATVAYDSATGGRLWVRRYDGPAGLNDYVSALAASPDGSQVFVTGSSSRSGRTEDYATVAYDAATGARQWVRRFHDPGYRNAFANALAVSPDGSEVFVTGPSYPSLRSSSYATVAYAAATGATLWVRHYNGSGNGTNYATGAAASPDGSLVFVTGYSHGSAGFDYATVAYDAVTGARQWVRRYDGPESMDDVAAAVAVSPDSSFVVVTGVSKDLSIRSHFATVAYDAATGATRWVRRYESAGDYNEATALAVSPDGSQVFVTGRGAAEDDSLNYVTVAYDAATGVKEWSKIYSDHPGGADEPSALAVSPNGSRVYVTGTSVGHDSYDYATVAYRS